MRLGKLAIGIVSIATIATLLLLSFSYISRYVLPSQKVPLQKGTVPTPTDIPKDVVLQTYSGGQEDVILTGKLIGAPYVKDGRKIYINIGISALDGKMKQLPIFLGLSDDHMSFGLISGSTWKAPSRYTGELISAVADRLPKDANMVIFITVKLTDSERKRLLTNCPRECQYYITWVENYGAAAKEHLLSLARGENRSKSLSFDLLAEQIAVLND